MRPALYSRRAAIVTVVRRTPSICPRNSCVCGIASPSTQSWVCSLNLDFMKSAPQAETLAIESEPPGAEAKTSLGQSCLTPCQLSVQPGSEFSVMLALRGYQPQTVSVRPEAEGAAAAPRLAPNPIHVDLQAVTPKKPIAKKKKPVATPTPAPAVAPAPSASEAAPSATKYPWPSR